VAAAPEEIPIVEALVLEELEVRHLLVTYQLLVVAVEEKLLYGEETEEEQAVLAVLAPLIMAIVETVDNVAVVVAMVAVVS
jgi:hypothetical protein